MRSVASTIVMLAWATASAMAQSDDVVGSYCVSCHGAPRPAARLNLVGFGPGTATSRVDVAERVVAKVRAGMMPPAGAPRPSQAILSSFVTTIEARIDAAARDVGAPARGPVRSVNRAEYARVVLDLFGLDVDPSQWLAPDTLSADFDNIGDAQTFSPAMVSGYLRGASRISRLAVTDPVSRRRLLVCRPPANQERPTELDVALPCASRILGRVIDQAYRGRADADDLADALGFFSKGRAGGGFDNGIRLALQSILVSPKFLFHFESTASDGQALASRLSFFLWGSSPDEALRRAASNGTLDTPAGLQNQARRMLADARASAFSARFAAQWLRLRDLESVEPDPKRFPQWNAALADAMRQETAIFVDSIRRDDRSVLDLLTADYSYLNEQLARHYGIDGVTGPHFRRVTMPEDRRGLLGQGSVLASTSVADRTSPVLRGKWILEVLLGMPPPPPPPNVPALDDSVRSTQGERRLSTRQRMEAHRRNPSCSSCHRVIDPLGLALEPFDATGAHRTEDNGVAVDASAEVYDGTQVDGPAGLRRALLAHRDVILRTFTQNLLTYALGRRARFDDMPAVRSIVAAAERKGNRVSAFVLGVVMSDQFRAGLEERP